MRISKNTLNNLMMENQRRTPVYQTLITDLAIAGVIKLEVAEMLLGYKIPGFLHTPDGKCLKAEEVKPAKKAPKKEEEVVETVEE